MGGKTTDCEPPIPLEAIPTVATSIRSSDPAIPVDPETLDELNINNGEKTLPIDWSESRKRLVVVIISGMSFVVYATPSLVYCHFPLRSIRPLQLYILEVTIVYHNHRFRARS
jgi:hypothetical protein